MSEIVKLVEVTPLLRKIRVNIKESKPKNPPFPKDKLHDKVKILELELSVAREQTNRSASSKLEHMLSIQKSPLDKTSLGFENSHF